MPYVGNKSTTFNTFSATDVSVTDDLTVTDDASVGGDLTTTGKIGAGGAVDGSSLIAVHGNDGIILKRSGQTNGFLVRPNGSTDGLRFSQGGTGDRLSINADGDIDVETGDILFSTAGKGIVLGATSNTDANTLEDYEEGTWTPGQGDGLTVNGSFSSSGKYTKIGRMVYIRGSVSGGTNIAFAKSTGSQLVTSLPFNGQPNADNGHSGCGQGDDLTDHFGLRQSLTFLYPTDTISTVSSISFTAMYMVS